MIAECINICENSGETDKIENDKDKDLKIKENEKMWFDVLQIFYDYIDKINSILTDKDKLEHHIKMEPACLKERKELIKLVRRYKLLLNRIIKDKNIDPNKNETIINLKKDYEEIQSKLIDMKLFVKYLGRGFDNDCGDIKDSDDENINNEEESNNDEDINNKINKGNNQINE